MRIFLLFAMGRRMLELVALFTGVCWPDAPDYLPESTGFAFEPTDPVAGIGYSIPCCAA